MSILERGQHVRLSNELNSPFVGMVTLAGENGAVAVMFEQRAIRTNGGGLAVTSFLPLMVDEANERVTDLLGNEWFVEVPADERT